MKKQILLLFAVSLVSFSCSRGLDYVDSERQTPQEVGHGMIELGEQLEDPYSLTNVVSAVKAIYPTKSVDLSATDIYVRFLPECEEEYDRLIDMGVTMIDHPLDYRIVKDGDYYHDPSLDEKSITWQYSVVSPKFKFPKDIKYEILDECYIPGSDADTKAGNDIDWARVEEEAFRLTGNADMLLPETKAGDEPVSVGPSGQIQIIDEAYNGGKPIGVKGVMVSVNSFVKFASAYTDDDGKYHIDRKYTSDIRYRLVFKNVKGFGIGFNLLLVPASISALGKNSPEGLDVLIDKNSDRKQFTRSVVNNAAYDYYTMTETTDVSVRTPPVNFRMWLFQNLGISCSPMFQQGAIIDSDLVGSVLGEYRDLVKMFLPDALIGLRDCQDYASVYSETMHQMAHASHFMQVGSSFWDPLIEFDLKSFITSGFVAYGTGNEENAGYCEVGEMWAYFMQNSMYRDRYGKDCPAIGSSFWFHPQAFLYMEERGITRGKIFKALSSDVIDKELLETKLISLYPENRNIIHQAFERYCY